MADGKSESGDLITLEVAARLLMVSPERVRQLIKMGYVSRPRPGRTTIVSAVQGYIRFLKDEDRKTTKTAADTRVRDARAAEIELRVAIQKRQMIPVDDATTALDILVGKVREEITGLPARVTRDIKLRRQIEAEVNGSQVRLSKALDALSEFAREGGELPYAGTADDT